MKRKKFLILTNKAYGTVDTAKIVEGKSRGHATIKTKSIVEPVREKEESGGRLGSQENEGRTECVLSV